MRQIKLFKGVEMDLAAIETAVNSWIQDQNIQVHKITGNIAPQTQAESGINRMSGSDILIIVEYEV